MYQDLFLTDIKREVEHVQQEIKIFKSEQNTANYELSQLKKENQKLNATLARYRRALAEQAGNVENGRDASNDSYSVS